MPQPTVFISYSHKDEKEKEALLSHLSVLGHVKFPRFLNAANVRDSRFFPSLGKRARGRSFPGSRK